MKEDGHNERLRNDPGLSYAQGSDADLSVETEPDAATARASTSARGAGRVAAITD